MKKLLTILLSLLLLLSLSACKSDNQGDSPSGGDTDGYVEGGDWGYLGDTMHTYWFDFTINSAYICRELGGYTAADGNQLLVVSISIRNTTRSSLPMYWDDFQIQWGDGDEDYGYPVAKDEFLTRDVLPDEYTIAINGSRDGLLVYEVPVTNAPDYAIAFQELFEEGVEGDVYFIYFTADTNGGTSV